MSMTVLITGTSRGIGRRLAEFYLERGDKVLAAARDTTDIADLAHAGAESFRLDVAADEDIVSLRRALAGRPIDVLINNAGIIGPDLVAAGGDMDMAAWRKVMEVNTYAPYRVTEALLDNVAAGNAKKIAFVSSRMGSIAETHAGNRIVYRVSKAALNQVANCLAHALRGRGIAVAALHPGHVSTDMGGGGAPVTPDQSAAGVIRVIDALTVAETGRFMAYDGTPIAW